MWSFFIEVATGSMHLCFAFTYLKYVSVQDSLLERKPCGLPGLITSLCTYPSLLLILFLFTLVACFPCPLCLQEADFHYVEMNASDTRSKNFLQTAVAQSLDNQTIDGMLSGESS